MLDNLALWLDPLYHLRWVHSQQPPAVLNQVCATLVIGYIVLISLQTTHTISMTSVHRRCC